MPTLLFTVGAVPKMPVWLTVDALPELALLAVDTLIALAPDVELLTIVPVVPPSDPLALVVELADVLLPKLPIPVVLVVEGVVTALEVIAAAVGRVSVADGPDPPPPELVVVLELELDVGEVMTPAALTLALGDVT